MMNSKIQAKSFFLFLAVSFACLSFGQNQGSLDELSERAADLEAQVRKLDATTVEGANVLLELSDLYHKSGRAFGMIRTGKVFVKVHRGHPRHKEIMLKLLDGYLVTSRNEDIVSTSRQFLEFYGKDAAAPRVARQLGDLLNRLGKRLEAAKVYEQAWKLSGSKDLRSAYDAVRLYGGNQGAKQARECARIAEEVLDKLPNGSAARELGWYALNQARYGNWDLKSSLSIGGKLLQRNLISDVKQRAELYRYLALDLWNQGQRTNSVQHFRKAWETQRDNPYHLEQLINYLGSSSAKAGQMLPHVNEYRRRFPENKIQLGSILSQLAHAYSRDKQPAQAVTVAAEALALNPTHNQVAYYYVQWINTLDPKRLPEAENVLRQAIPKVKPEHRYAVRYPLTIHLLRDKVKDPNRARGEAFQLLSEDSTGHSWVNTALNWFLDSATDQASFQRDAERVVKVAEANGNRSYLRSWLSTWAKAAGSTDDAKANKKWLRNRLKTLSSHPEIVAWTEFEKAVGNNKPKQFPELAKKLNTQKKFVHFHASLGYDYRHYSPDKGKANAITHYKALAKRFPKDSDRAGNWLDAANYGTPADRLEAVRHFLQADPVNSYSHWYNAFRAAHENKDDNLLRQVLQYVNKAEDKFGKSFGYVSNNAKLLLDRNMTAEAKQYLDRHMDIDPNQGATQMNEARNIVLLSLEKADENAKINLFEARRKQDNDLHGAYASDLAEILFKKKDWKRFAAVLRDARQRQDQRPFRTFSINTSLAGSWASSIRGDKEMEEAMKVDLLKAIRDLRAWNYSISAALALLELETGKPKTEMERLRAMRDATLTADNSTHGWNLGLAFAQSALSNDDYVGAATLLTSIQANSSNVPESYLANGRRLLSQAYSRIGGIGLTIDKDSPIAPLMEIVLHLRLGDNELALETYLANIGLFDSNRDEVPLELILFACENHIAAGGDANHERSEDILRGWLVKNSESKTFEVAEKASVQLLLGRNYFRWSRFDVARSEFMTVKNSFPDTEQAIEAEFGIGETFMSQKNYEKSEEVFEGLSNSRDSRVAIRADFMRGVLAARRDDRDEARNIFRSVLERVPNISLANETLYNLAEVYGVEQRYMDQLDLLRAVGRLGQESKRWHEPGVALSIVVQDSDLGISRGHTRIPVSITSLPSGDKETVYLISGGAGKGLFMAEIPTTLGQVTPNDRVLQLKGSDVVTVDYPEEFKKDFRFHMMSTNKIHIAANAEFDAASSIVAKNEEEEKTFTEELIDENEEEDEGVAEGRPANQIKPGNFIYLRVSDKDRDFTDEADQTLVKLEATSGDSVTVQLKETGLNTGIFIGRAKTDELPAGALASDVSIDSNPLMAIDKDADSAWVSEPDGIAPKWLTVDTKDIHGVTSVTLLSPNQPEISNQWVYRNAAGQDLALVLDDKGAYEAKSGETLVEKGKWEHSADRDILTLSPAEGNVTSFDWDYAKGRFIHGEKDNPHVREGLLSPGNQTPVRIRMRGSHDGRFWYELARFPLQASSSNPGLVKDEEGITQRVYKAPTNALTNWEDYFVKWIADKEPEEQEQVDAMDWEMDPDLIESDPKSAKQPRLIVWSGKFAQHKAGAVRFRVNANRSAIYLDGKLVLEPKSDQESAASGEVDVFLEPGAHELTIAAYVAKPATSGASVSRARENPNSAAVAMGPFTAFDFDLEDVPPAKKKEDEAEAVAVQATQRGSSWNFSIPQADVRYVEFIFDEFIGQSLSINQVEILAGDELLVPTQADVLAMSQNDILEITAGDVVTASYVDEVARGGRKNRLLTSNLSVTYFNAEIRAISYDFNRVGGNIQETIKDLMRVDPGERIVIEVTDYDMDSTAEVDKIPVEVILNNDDPIKLEAVETKEHSGIFRTQIDTSAEEEEGKLMVKAGDRVNLRYIDPQNTFPGHSFPRETFVFVRKPTEATARIVETRYIRVPEEPVKSVFLPLEGEPKEMAAFAYELPLTVEIIDPDMAKDSHSSIQVKILVGDENSSREVDVLCEISSSFGERTTAPIDFANWALYEGRFVGQVQLQLGGPESPSRIPAGVDGPQSVIGGIIPPPGETEDDGLDLTVRVLNLTGADVATLAYKDVDRPEDNGTVLQSQGRMISDGSLSITGPDYGDPVDLLFVGEKTYLRVIDPDHDVSDERDEVEVEIFSRLGEKEKVFLEETFSHSGVFTGSFKLDAVEKPVPGNLGNNSTAIETFFGDLLTATYIDETANVEEGSLESSAELAVSIGANGIISSFSKVFADEELAVRTQFHIAESYFELFKSHQKLGRDEEAATDLENGRRSLKQLVEDYPDPKYAPRVNYLLGQFSQELKQWSDAIDAYETIVRNYPEDTLAADAQYKLAQAYEEAERFDDALEAYVTLASTYPNSPLIANVMIRINEYFYRGENYLVAAKVGKKFIQRFESHQWAPKMAFRVGQCHYKAVSYKDAADAFDDFVKRFPDDKLCSEALFWGGESYRMGNNVPLAFQRYNRCRWDFPESDAAKYARGRLALPEMLRQFEAAANLDE